MSEGVEQIVEQRGHWRKTTEMGDVAPSLACHKCLLYLRSFLEAPN